MLAIWVKLFYNLIVCPGCGLLFLLQELWTTAAAKTAGAVLKMCIRDRVYQQEYERGKILYDLKVVGEAGARTGTTIRFKPDVKTGENPEPGVFETGKFEFETLKTRFRELAFLNRGVRITLTDLRCDPTMVQSHHYEGGIVSFVEYINRHKEPLFKPPV